MPNLNRYTAFLAIFLTCLGFMPIALAEPRDEDMPNIITNSSSNYRIRVEYPTLQNSRANSDIAFWAEQQANTFIRGIEDIQNLESAFFTLSITYNKNFSSNRCDSLYFKIVVDMGDMQPGIGLATFTYDRRDGRSLTLTDLFGKTAGIYPFLAVYCNKALKTQTYNANHDFFRIIDEMTTVEPTNYSFFNLNPDGLTFFFPLNQSDRFNQTEVTVKVPLREMKRFEPIRAYWSR